MSLDPDGFAELGAGTGQAAIVRQTARGTYNPATDAWTGDTSADTAVTAIIQNRIRRYENGTLVTVEGLSAFIPSASLNGVVPNEGDLLVVGANQYTLLNARQRRSGGILIGYSAELAG
jgi:hypothetical protein